ncbi:hypothetical protein ACFFRR_011654 [Megaselia abdita]
MFKILIFVSIFACAFADKDSEAKIGSYSSDIHEDGSYSYQFDTTNGIVDQWESGIGGQYATGQSAYYSPDGELIQLTYYADSNGFQAEGPHLPTPPPIPEQIIRSLEYNKLHPNSESQ